MNLVEMSAYWCAEFLLSAEGKDDEPVSRRGEYMLLGRVFEGHSKDGVKLEA
ncbi:MAG: hypothetical protein Q4F18_09945 [Clostridia bacterium]|nr:hypothetical protein [Clostridia bacterium]